MTKKVGDYIEDTAKGAMDATSGGAYRKRQKATQDALDLLDDTKTSDDNKTKKKMSEFGSKMKDSNYTKIRKKQRLTRDGKHTKPTMSSSSGAVKA